MSLYLYNWIVSFEKHNIIKTIYIQYLYEEHTCSYEEEEIYWFKYMFMFKFMYLFLLTLVT